VGGSEKHTTCRPNVIQCVNACAEGHPMVWCLSKTNYRVFTIQQTSSKLPANVFKIHVWTFAGSCKHPISVILLVIGQQQPYSCSVASGKVKTKMLNASAGPSVRFYRTRCKCRAFYLNHVENICTNVSAAKDFLLLTLNATFR